MSYNNRNGADPKKVYDIFNPPPAHKSGGPLDKEGIDSYWGPSRTVQADEKNANIHLILERYQQTGQLPMMIQKEPKYGDFAEMPTYQESLNLVIHAQAQFMALDAKIRAKFDNDTAKFLEFATDPKNQDKLIEMGLAKKKVEMPAPKGEKDPAASPLPAPDAKASPKAD